VNPPTDDREEPGSGTPTPLVWGRRIILALAGLLLSLAVLAGIAIAALQIDAVSGFVARTAAEIASSDSLDVEVGGATGSWLWSLELTDLEISARSDDAPAWTLSADMVSARYDLLPLLRRHVSISEARVTGLTAWSALSASQEEAPEETTTSSRWSVAVDRASVDVRELALAVPEADEPWRLTDGRLRLRDVAMGEELRGGVLNTLVASFRPPGRPDGWGRVAASGALEAGRVRIDELLLHSPESDVSARGRVPLTLAGTAPDGLELEVSLAPLHLGDVGPFLPETIPDSLRVRAEGRVWTSDDTAHVRFDAGTDVPGRLTLVGRVWGPRAAPEVAGVLDLTSVDLRAWGLASRALVLNSALEFELANASPEELRRAHGTMRIEARIDEPAGRVGGLLLEAHADAEGSPWSGSWTASGLGLDGDGNVLVDLGEQQEWSLDGAVSYVLSEGRAPPGPTESEERAGVRPQAAAATFDAEGRGFTPDSLTGRVTLTLDSLRVRVGAGDVGARIGPGRVQAEMRQGRTSAELVMEVGGGRVETALEGNVPERTLDSIWVSLVGVDVASVVGDTLASSVHAELSGDISSMSPLRATGRLRVHAAEYGPWALASARASADARDGDVLVRLAAALRDSGRVGARGTFRMEEGVVRRATLDSLEWAGLDLRTLVAAPDSAAIPSTALFGSGEGTAALDQDGWSGALTLRMAPSTVGQVQLDRGSAELRVGPEVSEAHVVLEAGETLVEADARSSGSGDTRRIEVSELRFRQLDLSAWTAGQAMPTQLTGSASSEILGTDPAHAVGGGRLDMWSSSIGTTALDTASLTVSADSGYIQAEAVAEGLGGILQLRGDGDLSGARPTYSVRGSVERSAPPEPRALALVAHFGLAGQGTQPDSMNADVWFEVDSARWAGHEVEHGSLRAGIGEGILRVDTLSVTLPGAELAAGGDLPLSANGGRRGELRLRGSLTGADLVRGLRESGTLAVGDAGVDVTATGSVDDLQVEGDAFMTALLLDDIRVQGMELSGAAHRTAANGWVEGQATLEVDRVRLPTAPLQSVRLEASLEPGDELAIQASAVIDGRRDAQVSLHVEKLPTPAAVRIENMAFRADQDRWTLAHPTRVSLSDGIEVDSLRLSTEGQRLELRGRFGLEGPLDLHASAESFDIATVADLLGYPTLRGRVTGALDLGGTAASPVLEAGLRSRLTPTDAPASDLAVNLGYQEGTADFEASVTLDDGPRLSTAATVPFQFSFADSIRGFVGDAPMRGTMTAQSFPLQWFEPFLASAAASQLVGRLDGNAEMEGSPDSPSFRGGLSLTDGGVTLAELGVRYREANAHLTFRGTEILVDSARVRSNDGTLSAEGTVTVGRIDRPSYDLTVTADGFTAMRSSAVHATISGRVNVQGTGLTPRVGGVVEVERADLYLADLMSGSTVDAVTLTPEQWEELAAVFGYTRPDEGAETPPLMDSVTLDLDVRLGRASWVRQQSNPAMALQFSGEMSVQKQPGDSIQLVGSIEAVPDRSWVEQFGRRFEITQGVLTFHGTPASTEVDVQAEYRVPSRENPGEPEVVLTLGVTGTPDDLSLELSSTPPLEASDMVAYLVTGRPASQSLSGGGEGSLTDAGGALALGRLSGAVESYAREQVGLDVVEVTTDGLDGVTLLAGRYLSPSLYLGVRQPISMQRSSEDPTQRAPNTELELEFQAVRWLLLNLRAGGRLGVEFYVRSRIAYD